MSNYPAQPWNAALDALVVDAASFVREWTDSGNNGTLVVVGMLALKLWDDDAEVYRELSLVGNQLNFDNDPVAIEDDPDSTLRRAGIILYDDISDNDCFLRVESNVFLISGNLHGQGGQREIVTNFYRNVFDFGQQQFQVDERSDSFMRINVISAGTADGYGTLTLLFNAEDGFEVRNDNGGTNSQFLVTNSNISIYTNSGGIVSIVGGSVQFNAAAYSVANPGLFRKAIKSPSKFHVFALGGV